MNNLKVELKKSWEKKNKTRQVSPFALLPNSYFAGSSGARGAGLAPEHPEGLACCRSGCPGVLPAGRTGASPGGCRLACHWPAETAWEGLHSQLCLFSAALTALCMNSYLAGLRSNLADPEEGGRGWTGLLVLDPGCFLYLQVPLKGGFMLEKGLTGTLCNLFLFPFPPFSSFTKC